MDWNGWHSVAQVRGDGLRPELLEGLERVAWRRATVIELDNYRRECPVITDADTSVSCEIIPFPVLAKPRNASKPRGAGLKPRQSRAKNLTRAGRAGPTKQPE